MAVGKTAHMSVSEVKSHLNSLECSPSKSSRTSPIYGKGSTPTARKVSGGSTHAGKRSATKETPSKLGSANSKRGH